MRDLLTILICVLVVADATARTLTLRVTVVNDWTEQQTDEPVVVDLHKVNGWSWHVASATVMLGRKEIPCQLDDLNGDYRADELVFLTDIGAGKRQTFTVTLSDEGRQKDYPARTYAHMSISSNDNTYLTAFETLGKSNVFNNLYHHGVCFESELVGYRIYSDSRQNVDVYGKWQHRLELATTKFNSTTSHLQQGYGHDVLWNGQSIACGTLRDYADGRPQLVEDVQRRGQRILSQGPVRTIVEVSDLGWHSTLCCHTRYTLYAGHRDVCVEARFDTPLPDTLLFCTGVQKIGSKPQGYHNGTLLGSWGTDWPDYGKKDIYQKQSVGLAVCVPQEYIYNNVEDSLSYLCVLRAPGHTMLRYWLMSCADMEQGNNCCHSADEWFASLPHWREHLSHPLKSEILKQKQY